MVRDTTKNKTDGSRLEVDIVFQVLWNLGI